MKRRNSFIPAAVRPLEKRVALSHLGFQPAALAGAHHPASVYKLGLPFHIFGSVKGRAAHVGVGHIEPVFGNVHSTAYLTKTKFYGLRVYTATVTLFKPDGKIVITMSGSKSGGRINMTYDTAFGTGAWAHLGAAGGSAVFTPLDKGGYRVKFIASPGQLY